MYPQAIVMYTVITLVAYSLFAFSQWRRFDSRFIYAIWLLALIIIGMLFTINILYVVPGTESDGHFTTRHFSFDNEGTFANYYSGILLFSVSFAALGIALTLRHDKRSDARYWVWLLISLLFFVVAFDEYFNPLYLHGQDFTLYGYVACGALSALLLLYILLFTSAEKKWRYLWVFIGLGMIGFAGVLIDNKYILTGFLDVALIEEILEILGTLTVLIVAISVLYDSLSKRMWNIVKLASFTAIVSVIIGFVISPQLRPTLVYYLGDMTRDSTLYTEDAIELVGYDLSSDVIHPGDTITGYLYFRANEPIHKHYNFSVHLLSIPDRTSVEQQEYISLADETNTRSWVPGLVMRERITITVPDDVATPTAYSLAVFVWSSDPGFLEGTRPEIWQLRMQNMQLLPIQSSDNEVIGTDSLLLVDYVVLPTDAPPTLDGTLINSDEGIQLTIADLDMPSPDAGDTLPLQFQWSVTEPIAQNWQQILHLQNIDTEDVFIFDRPPFNGQIPTTTWRSGFTANDDITITLPDDLPSGEYRLVTGLYNIESLERLSFQGDYPNDLATITTFTIE